MSDKDWSDIDNIVDWTNRIVARHAISFDQALKIMEMIRQEDIISKLEDICLAIPSNDE